VAHAQRDRPDAVGQVRVLGPSALIVPGAAGPVEVRLSPVQRRLVARLALAAGSVVRHGELADATWEGAPPRTAVAALRNQVSRLRAIAGDGVVLTAPDGYALGWPDDARAARQELRACDEARRRGEVDTVRACAEGIVQRYVGVPFDDLDGDAAHAGRRVAEEVLDSALVARLWAALEQQELWWAVPEAERLVESAPLDERRWLLLIDALARSGRRGEALGAVGRARAALRRAGLAPGPALTEHEASLLRDAGTARRPAPPRIVGRDPELAAVERALRAGRLVRVTGEPGIGRSAVLAEVAGRARRAGHRAPLVTCTITPASPAEVLVALLDDLGEAVDPSLGPVNGFVGAVAAAAAARPITIVVDDAHLAGPSTLAGLVAAAAVDRVGVVCATIGRDDVGPALDGAQVVEIGPMAEHDLGRLLAAHEPERALLAEDLAAIHELAGGNPLLALAVREERREAGGAGPVDPRPGRASIGDVVRERIRRLDQPVVRSLEWAAVLGTTAPRAVLERLAGAGAISGALRSGMLVDAEGLRFRHRAVRDVIESDIPPATKAEMHHTAGELLRAESAAAAVVAHHMTSAGSLDPVGAVDAAVAAAAAATSAGAHREAATWLGHARAWAPSLPVGSARRSIELDVARGDALRLAGDPAHVAVLLDAADRAEALGEADLVADAAVALLQLGAAIESGALDVRGDRLVERALTTVADPRRRSKVLAVASLSYSMAGDTRRCRAYFDEAVRLATDDATRRFVLPFAYMSLGHPSDLDRRASLGEELLVLSGGGADPVASFEGLQIVASVAMQRGDGARLRDAVERMDELVDLCGDVGRRWTVLYLRAAVAQLDDDLAEAERLSDLALALFSPVSPSRAFAVHGQQLLIVRWLQGRLGELTPVIERLVADQPAVPAWHAALALAVAGDDPARASDHAGIALRQVKPDFTWLASQVVGGRAAAIARAACVAEYRERLVPWSGLACWAGTCCYGPVDTVLAMLAAAEGDGPAAALHRQRALDLAGALGSPSAKREVERQVPAHRP